MMIQSRLAEDWPTGEDCLEDVQLCDSSANYWGISRTVQGLYLRFDSYPNAKQWFNTADGQLVKNHNCIFFGDTSFEFFADLRDAIMGMTTFEVYQMLTDFFSTRLSQNPVLLDSEVCECC
jgi:hypothetical protein